MTFVDEMRYKLKKNKERRQERRAAYETERDKQAIQTATYKARQQAERKRKMMKQGYGGFVKKTVKSVAKGFDPGSHPQSLFGSSYSQPKPKYKTIRKKVPIKQKKKPRYVKQRVMVEEEPTSFFSGRV